MRMCVSWRECLNELHTPSQRRTDRLPEYTSDSKFMTNGLGKALVNVLGGLSPLDLALANRSSSALGFPEIRRPVLGPPRIRIVV